MLAEYIARKIAAHFRKYNLALLIYYTVAPTPPLSGLATLGPGNFARETFAAYYTSYKTAEHMCEQSFDL